MKNRFVADILYQIADLLDVKGEIFFKTRAYRIAAQTIETLDEDIETPFLGSVRLLLKK